MAYSTTFICILLVAFGSHASQAQSIIMWQVDRLAADIDRMVDTARDESTTYVNGLQELFDHLNTSASRDLRTINSTVDDVITSITSKVDGLVADANGTNTSECTNSSTTLISRATEIGENATSCINAEVNQAEEEVALTIGYVNFQLEILTGYQSFAQHCIARYHESEQTTSDASQALACVQPLHRSAQLFTYRFGFIIDIELAEDLFSGFQLRVAICTRVGISELETLTSTEQSVYEEISTCVNGAN